MSFGERLAKLRKEKGMNQEELAQELNVTRQAVSKWESNSAYPETEKIIAICKLFDYSMDELIGIKEKDNIAEETKDNSKNFFIKIKQKLFNKRRKNTTFFNSIEDDNQVKIRHIHIFSYIKKIIRIISKVVMLCLTIPIAIFFILTLALLLFNIYFLHYGLILIYTALILITLSIIFYLILEILVKLLLNIKLKTKRIFSVFIISLIILGISLGCFFCELTTYKIKTIEFNSLVATQNLKMYDDEILFDLDNSEVVFEERDDIKIEYYGNPLFTYDTTNGFTKDYIYGVVTTSLNSYIQDYTIKGLINYYLESIKKKEIYINNNDISYREVIYISQENYDKNMINKEERHKFFTNY